MKPEFPFTAFISYSHKDKQFAYKLHHYLEHYTLPRAIRRKYPHIPKHLRPVFIDSAELGIGHLRDNLREAIACSRYLIVICSQNSARPNNEGINWIDLEVRSFLELRPENAKRVIPIILREKGSARAQECLLPIIKELGILGADVRAQGEERAFNDVIAKMTGLTPNELWDRHEREKRFWRRLQWLGGALAATLTAVASWGAWYYYTPHVSYYTDYVERNNVPEGLFELTAEQVNSRHRHYRFTEHKLRLRTVEHCNSAGSLQEHMHNAHRERPASMELNYDEGGKVVRCIHRNAQGKEMTVRKFSPGCVDFVQRKGESQMEVAQSVALRSSLNTDNSSGGKADIGRYVIRRDPEGAITQELYRRAFSDSPAQDAQGLSGRSYKLDALGRPEEVRYLRELPSGEVEPTETPQGIAGYRLSYGEQGLVTEMTYINKEGNAVLNEENWATRRSRYDEKGNHTEHAYFGADGKPCVLTQGYSRATFRYDAQGNQSEIAYFGPDEQPCLYADGYARLVWTYDERGNIIEEAYFAADGPPALHNDGDTRITMRYDARGNRIEQAHFGTDGKPCLIPNGYARVIWQYDKHGNKTEHTYFGVDNKPCSHKDGYARMTKRYDERGNRVEEACFGADGKPCLHKNGYARARWRYDDRGNSIEAAYYGIDGQPCAHMDGYARREWSYDSRGNATEEAYFGVDGKPCPQANGVARRTYSYGAMGNLILTVGYDAEGKEISREEY